jgi:hypothetical protein
MWNSLAPSNLCRQPWLLSFLSLAKTPLGVLKIAPVACWLSS